jgi:hypothetical protein
MSQLQKAIEELLKKQKEVELYSDIRDSLNDLLSNPKTDLEVTTKVIGEIQAFCQKKISLLEGVGSTAMVSTPEKEPIVAIVEEVSKKNVPAENASKKTEPIIDPLKFIVKYKDWQDKPVIVTDGYGNKVEGKVVGAAFPNLKVEFLDGSVLPTHPEDVFLK